jgi:[calcium/calmodulin-dependent protein kinase] kinase
LEENWSYLSIGPSTYTGTSQEEEFPASDPVPIFVEPDSTEDIDLPTVDDPVIVSESPGAADFDIYETAYGKELERIRSEITQTSAGAGAGTGTDTGTDEGAIPGPKVYLTRRVEGKDEVMKFVKDKTLNLQVGQKFSSPSRGPSTAFGAAVSMLRNQIQQQKEQAGSEEQRQQSSEHNQAQAQAQQQERRGSHPYSSASIPEPEPSALEATGIHTDAPAGDSSVKLRRLLNRARDKSGE